MKNQGKGMSKRVKILMVAVVALFMSAFYFPLHEVSHLVALEILGGKGDIVLNWFDSANPGCQSFSVGLCVQIQRPAAGNEALVRFAGGFGPFLVFTIGILIWTWITPTRQDLPFESSSFFWAMFGLFGGISEAIFLPMGISNFHLVSLILSVFLAIAVSVIFTKKLVDWMDSKTPKTIQACKCIPSNGESG